MNKVRSLIENCWRDISGSNDLFHECQWHISLLQCQIMTKESNSIISKRILKFANFTNITNFDSAQQPSALLEYDDDVDEDEEDQDDDQDDDNNDDDEDNQQGNSQTNAKTKTETKNVDRLWHIEGPAEMMVGILSGDGMKPEEIRIDEVDGDSEVIWADGLKMLCGCKTYGIGDE